MRFQIILLSYRGFTILITRAFFRLFTRTILGYFNYKFRGINECLINRSNCSTPQIHFIITRRVFCYMSKRVITIVINIQKNFFAAIRAIIRMLNRVKFCRNSEINQPANIINSKMTHDFFIIGINLIFLLRITLKRRMFCQAYAILFAIYPFSIFRTLRDKLT